MFVIDDSTPIDRLWSPEGWKHGRGLSLDDKATLGYAGVADPFPDRLVIPRSEWQARIQERKERGMTTRERLKRAGIGVYDQKRLNYCWVFAPTFCLAAARTLTQNQEYVKLSPASAGSQIKNYRNVGGWGREALQWLSTHGVNTDEQWPSTTIDRRYATEANRQAALNYRADEWWQLQDGNVDHLVSAILRGFLVPVGYNWWGHEVSGIDVAWIDGDVALDIANSWSEAWGEEGFGYLQGRRMIPDDAVAIRSIVPYAAA